MRTIKVRRCHRVWNRTDLVDLPLLLATFNSRLALLLAVCKTRDGATEVLNSGIFPAIQASRLFSTDPDLGLGTSFPFDDGLTLTLRQIWTIKQHPNASTSFLSTCYKSLCQSL